MSDINRFMEKQSSYEKALAEANASNKQCVFEALAQASITSVTVEFDGEGDSGQIESVIAMHGEDRLMLPRLLLPLQHVSWNTGVASAAETLLAEAITQLCYGYLEAEHGGWENNDGAFGTFTFDVPARTIHLEFNGRFSEYFTTTHTL